MTEIRSSEQTQTAFRLRALVAGLFVLAGFAVLLFRFGHLQLTRHEDYAAQAEDNRVALVPTPPARGEIFDRDGNQLASNTTVYTVEIEPFKVENLQGTIDSLAKIIQIDDRDRRRFKRLYEDSRRFDSIPIKSQLSDEDVAKVAAVRHLIPGVDVRARAFRSYPLGETGSHIIGYIGRISQRDRSKLEEQEEAANYAGSTHIGKTGVEQSYESQLHGRTGFERLEVSAGGKALRTLSRDAPAPGSSVVLSIDITLQKFVEDMFGKRKGALVAIDPTNGEIVAFVSKPTFDPNLFIDGIDQASWDDLNNSPDKPLLNRPLRGTYPPGSTYKPFMALAALTTGKRTPGFTISDPGYFMFGNHKFRDSNPNGNGSVNLHKSIVVSSDTYYYMLARDMGVDMIHDFMKPWGFGQITGVDLQGELQGILPSQAWKQKRYKKPWLAGETISIGIGQGYNNFTILQLAHATATLAADGTVIKPRLVKALIDGTSRERRELEPEVVRKIELDPEHLRLVKSAMVDVNRMGTAARVFAGAPYVAAGKTGTAQVIGIKANEKYDARKIAERFRDHSLYMAFAPVDNPKLAIALIVENGGFGAEAAAPIARKVFDYWLAGRKLPSATDPGTPVKRAADGATATAPPDAAPAADNEGRSSD